MDQVQAEIQEMLRTARGGAVPQPGEDPFAAGVDPFAAASGKGATPPGLEGYSHEQLMAMYEALQKGEMPENLQSMEERYSDANGKPIIDAEGGAVIKPIPGFVVKTKDQSGGKVFVNMTHHDLVESFEAKPITTEEAQKHGNVREESDKKGDPCQVYDFIWATETVKEAQKSAVFRQQMVELAFTYILQKFERELDMRFTIPKLKYKGATVQYQRIRAKKGPKIEEVQLSEEEKAKLQAKAMEEERKREAVREREPDFKLYCILDERLNQNFGSQEYLTQVIKREFEQIAGDENDRWTYLTEKFEMKEQYEVFEEYDGLNQEDASGLFIVVTLPMLARGHAIQCHVLSDEFIQVQVPNLYNLLLGLPLFVNTDSVKTYFDCKIRRLFIHLEKREDALSAPLPEEEEAVEEEPEVFEEVAPKQEEKVEAPADDDDDVEVIDTDVHFGRENTGKRQAEPKKEAPKVTDDFDDDLLYDLC